MFYYNYVKLCNQKGISPSAAAEQMGFKRSMVTRWNQGTQPRMSTLQRIADYFRVSIDELTKENPAIQTNDELLRDTNYLKLSPENRKIVDALIDQLLKGQSDV